VLIDDQVAIMAIPHPELGQEAYAVLSDFNGKTVDELKTQVVEQLGQAYVLAGAVDLKTLGIEHMPLNPTGKVQKLELQGPLEAWLKGQGS